MTGPTGENQEHGTYGPFSTEPPTDVPPEVSQIIDEAVDAGPVWRSRPESHWEQDSDPLLPWTLEEAAADLALCFRNLLSDLDEGGCSLTWRIHGQAALAKYEAVKHQNAGGGIQ